MKVVYTGAFGKVSGGCIPCGKRRKSDHNIENPKSFYLPSGVRKTFYLGKETEVSESDGNFLLDYEVTDKNGTRKVFKRVV